VFHRTRGLEVEGALIEGGCRLFWQLGDAGSVLARLLERHVTAAHDADECHLLSSISDDIADNGWMAEGADHLRTLLGIEGLLRIRDDVVGAALALKLAVLLAFWEHDNAAERRIALIDRDALLRR